MNPPTSPLAALALPRGPRCPPPRTRSQSSRVRGDPDEPPHETARRARASAGTPMTRFRWLLATSLRGLRARWVLSLGSLLLTVISIASAGVGPSYQQNAANSFVIAQLRAQPFINIGLTYDYQPDSTEWVD